MKSDSWCRCGLTHSKEDISTHWSCIKIYAIFWQERLYPTTNVPVFAEFESVSLFLELICFWTVIYKTRGLVFSKDGKQRIFSAVADLLLCFLCNAAPCSWGPKLFHSRRAETRICNWKCSQRSWCWFEDISITTGPCWFWGIS